MEIMQDKLPCRAKKLGKVGSSLELSAQIWTDRQNIRLGIRSCRVKNPRIGPQVAEIPAFPPIIGIYATDFIR